MHGFSSQLSHFAGTGPITAAECMFSKILVSAHHLSPYLCQISRMYKFNNIECIYRGLRFSLWINSGRLRHGLQR